MRYVVATLVGLFLVVFVGVVSEASPRAQLRSVLLYLVTTSIIYGIHVAWLFDSPSPPVKCLECK